MTINCKPFITISKPCLRSKQLQKTLTSNSLDCFLQSLSQTKKIKTFHACVLVASSRGVPNEALNELRACSVGTSTEIGCFSGSSCRGAVQLICICDHRKVLSTSTWITDCESCPRVNALKLLSGHTDSDGQEKLLGFPAWTKSHSITQKNHLSLFARKCWNCQEKALSTCKGHSEH